jgi:hypothetical protein
MHVELPQISPKWKYSLIILCVLAFLIIAGLLFVKQRSASQYETDLYLLSDEITDKINSHENLVSSKERISSNLEILRNETIDDQKRYEELIFLINNIADAYYGTNDPFFRNFISKDLNSFTKKHFSDQYSSNYFVIACADATCGEDTPKQMEEIITIIKNSKIDEGTKNAILKNVKNMSFLPKENLDEKEYIAEFIIGQLNREEDQDASKAATLLKEYFRSNFNVDL